MKHIGCVEGLGSGCSTTEKAVGDENADDKEMNKLPAVGEGGAGDELRGFGWKKWEKREEQNDDEEPEEKELNSGCGFRLEEEMWVLPSVEIRHCWRVWRWGSCVRV